VFANTINFGDVRAGPEQVGGERLLLLQADTFGRYRQQGGAAARQKAENEILIRKVSDHCQNAFRGVESGRIRNRVGRFYDLDPLAGKRMSVRGDDKA
jgi:hypothetical protein